MSRADVNRAIDPDRLPGMSEDGRPSTLREQSDLGALGLLDPLPSGAIDELGEEPPWVSEFLAQYRLVFGSSSRIAPPTSVHPEPIRIAETQPALPEPLGDEIATSVVQEALPGHDVSSDQPVEQPLQILQKPLLLEWSWTHTIIGLATAALLGALIPALLMRPRHHVNDKDDVPPPIVRKQAAPVESASPVSPIATPEQDDSKERSDRFAEGQATASARSSNVVDSSDSGSGQVHSVGNGSVGQDSEHRANREGLSAPSSLPPSIVTDEYIQGVPLRRVQPIYPSEALLRKLDGPVALQAEISQDGKVRTVRVLSGDPILARAAVVAVRQWIYAPSSSDERERRQQQITIRFKAR